jgi:hypothetical protein
MKVKNILLSVCCFGLLVSVDSCAPKKDKKLTTDLVNTSASASGNAPAGKGPEMKFERETHDFGKISQGERVSTAFKFKNIGGSELIISEAHGSCGCTVPDYPKEPIAPGEEGVINVEFNSEGKHDEVTKTVSITTNCEVATKMITIKANVVVPAERGGK